MNCKPGEVAVIVAPYGRRELRGLPVTVVRLALDGEVVFPSVGLRCKQAGEGAGWVCEGHSKHLPRIVADHCLRPIRPDGVSKDEVDALYTPQLTEVTP